MIYVRFTCVRNVRRTGQPRQLPCAAPRLPGFRAHLAEVLRGEHAVAVDVEQVEKAPLGLFHALGQRV